MRCSRCTRARTSARSSARHRDTVLARHPRPRRRKKRLRKRQARERDQVDCDFPQVTIQLPREADTRGDAAHGGANEMIEVPVGRSGELEGTEANVVERLVV